MSNGTKSTGMSDEHKAALAEGRSQGRAVRSYLEALAANRPKRGRKRTPESIKQRLEAIEGERAEANPLKQLQLVQERINLENELATVDQSADLTDLENQFVKAAGSYGRRKGISYAAWRETGVSAATLRAAGISRSAS